MWWLIIPIAGFIIILCVVVQDHYNTQMDKIRKDEQSKAHPTYHDYNSDEPRVIECETTDEPIYCKVMTDQNYTTKE